MSSIRRAAKAIRHQDKNAVENQVREFEYAEVRRVNPLVVKLEGSTISLDDEDLTMSQWLKAYDDGVGIKRGDRLAVKRMRGGGWMAMDVIGGPDAGPYPGDNSVNTAKIANDAVTPGKLAPSVLGAGSSTHSFTSASSASWSVAHGLGTTPTSVVASASRASGGSIWNVSVGNFTGTNFTVEVASIDGTNHTSATVYWIATAI